MAKVNVIDVLSKVYGARGLPFPGHPLRGEGSKIAEGFNQLDRTEGSAIAGGFDEIFTNKGEFNGTKGTPIKRYTDESLGQYEFLPVMIDDYEIPNSLLIITGEKEFIETDVIGVLDKDGNAVGGTVFEKAFTRPYDISIIATLIGVDGTYPEGDLIEVIRLWKKDEVVTLKCALTDLYLPPTNNFLIKKISHLDAAGAENVEVIQIDGRSNVEFELVIK